MASSSYVNEQAVRVRARTVIRVNADAGFFFAIEMGMSPDDEIMKKTYLDFFFKCET
jgi:uncharacterized protein with NRDE domain